MMKKNAVNYNKLMKFYLNQILFFLKFSILLFVFFIHSTVYHCQFCR